VLPMCPVQTVTYVSGRSLRETRLPIWLRPDFFVVFKTRSLRADILPTC
jgi:hypothetical protein